MNVRRLSRRAAIRGAVGLGVMTGGLVRGAPGGGRLAARPASPPADVSPVRTVLVDSALAPADTDGPVHPANFAMVGVGDVDWLTAPRFTRLLDNLAASPGAFRLARVSGVLNSGTRDDIKPGGGGLVWPSPSSPMNFSATFAGLAELTSRGLTPFVSLGYFPQAVSSTPIAPPADYGTWRQLVRAFFTALHADPRFGPAIKDWWFEVWNEPNQDRFWTGRFSQYLDLYRATSAAVADTGLAIRLGGPAISYQPASSPDAGAPTMAQFLQFLAREPAVRCDFLSFHRKGTFDATEATAPDLQSLVEAVAETARTVRTVGARRLATIPLINDEADMKVGFEVPFEPRMDERFAAWLTAVTIAYAGLNSGAAPPALWAAADDAAQQLIQAPFDGRRSVMTRTSVAVDDLLKLPVYNSYELLRLLGERRGRILVGGEACYPHSDLFHLITVGEDQLCALFTVHPRTGQTPPPAWEVDFALLDIPWPQVNVARFRIDHTFSNAYTAAGRRLDIAVPSEAAARIRQAQELTVDAPIRRGLVLADGTLRETVVVPPFGVLAYWVTPFRSAPPATPSWISATPADGNIVLRWTPTTDPMVSSYEVYVRRDGTTPIRLSPDPLRAALWVDTAPPGGRRVYLVCAVSASGRTSPLVASPPVIC